MIITERHSIKSTPELLELCSLSKELYNRCNFILRKSFFTPKSIKIPFPNISILVQQLQKLECYKNLHNTKTAKKTILKCLTDWTNFFKALRAYKINSSKFLNKPKPPHYKKKLASVIFDRETIKGGQSKNSKHKGFITPTNDLFKIKSNKSFKQVVVTPVTFGFIVEVSYDSDEQFKIKGEKINDLKLNKNNFISIDLGINNLCSITSNQLGALRPILINGRPLKSINQYYNKNKCKRNSRKRYFRIENYFHHTSKFIINYCIKNDIGKIIIGKNDGWKAEINLGKKTNQSFNSIPHNKLISKIKYKAELQGIEVILTEESYTSKASFIDNDILPKFYKENKEKYEFNGKRISRGLYKSIKSNFVLNADVNGSLNIARKVIPEFCFPKENKIGDRSLAARPQIINVINPNNGEGCFS